MYFKRLEMVGFKSFLSKTRLKFEPGVTAVVGPNGCGKSNIVDAIKWVLGEQSTKSMRSSSMQDVIFNGTEKHDPVNVAEVSLTLSNEERVLPLDYDEVTITRRLYRSGESEYLLNKTAVRLMDIRNLLMGTGMGTSSYSIVEQGRMDLILSSKPEDRRYVFEEASGITRYKSQKREALLKLEKTRDNLLRINDIIKEVERQISSIERKARKAERYRSRFDELKALEIKLAVKKFRELGTDDSSLLEEHSKIRSSIENMEKGTEELSSSLLVSREELNSVTEDLNRSQNEVIRISTDMEKNSHTIELNRERTEDLTKQVERFDREIEEATERKEEMKERLAELESRFAEVSSRRDNKEEALKSAEENLKELSGFIEHCVHEVKTCRDRIVDVAAERTRAGNALVKTGADIQNSGSRKKRLESELSRVGQEKERTCAEAQAFEEELGAIGSEMESRKGEYEVFSAEYSEKQKELTELFAEKAGKERVLHELRPRREFLEKLISEREGMPESVKDVMKKVEAGEPLFSGVRGILSEMVSIPDDYEESVRAVVGDAANSLVVDNVVVAERVMEYLSENARESVSFILIDELKRSNEGREGQREYSEEIKELPLDIVPSLPEADAMRMFFRDIIVAPEGGDPSSAESIERGYTLVSGKGGIRRKGMIRSRNFSSLETVPLFGRKEKALEMRTKESGLIGQIDTFSRNIDETEKWIDNARALKEGLEAGLRDLQTRFSEALSRRSTFREKISSFEREVSVLVLEIDEEKETLEALHSEKVKLENDIKNIDEQRSLLEVSAENAQRSMQENSIRREETLFCLADIKAELSGLRRDHDNLGENLKRERASFDRLDSDIAEKSRRISESGERIRELALQTDELEKANGELNLLVENLSENIRTRKEHKERLSHEVEDMAARLSCLEKELETLRDKARDVDIMKKEIEYKKESIAGRIKDTYKEDIKYVDIEIDPAENWDAVVSGIDSLRSQLEKMGDVSLGAVEEHKQLEQRYIFLTGQRDDLESSREQLLSAIQKINRTTRKQFMESFEAIRKEFNDYFRMLFNGGKADLVLEDEKDVLESGIDIVVRPPGKKLHNILQLSGGEKAMTAIALIFAIFKVNPSPFCVLDEIDAPLDEANIVRFCRVLQEFLKLSQFVIVTHNRMTIQLADVLYGITMQEKGVSKTVSVKFDETKGASEEELTVGAAA